MSNKIIYQLALRTFTPAGTLHAAAERLGHVASLGVDIIYVCAFFKADDDCNRASWSPRQRESCTDNPKNPYKIIDYFHVDSEYGTDADLKFFMETAHKLGLKVLFDLVYFHCGFNAPFVAEHPDFILRNPDGTPQVGEKWPFARLNYASQDLRDYLKSNIAYLIDEYQVDGFRCDVGDRIPLDFWKEAFLPLKEKYPHLLLLSEGKDPASLEVFDWLYTNQRGKTIRRIFLDELPASEYRELRYKEEELYGKDTSRLLRMLENHDTVSDIGLPRNEVTMTSPGVEAALVLINTFEGISFLWNGYEMCDDAENNMFSNRFHGKRSAMDWSNAFTDNGKRRLDFIKKIHSLRHSSTAIDKGTLEWVENDSPEAVLSYRRIADDENLLVVINTKNRPVTVTIDADLTEILMENNIQIKGNTLVFDPYGYLIAK